MNFYKHHLGDYIKRTLFFSMAQHGAYRLMIDYCYVNEGPLPVQKNKIYEICKAGSKANKQDVDTVLAAKWVLEDDGYHNDRIDEELGIYRAKADKNKANGFLGGRPKITQTVSTKITQTVSEKEPNDNLSQNPVTSNQIKTLSGANAPEAPDGASTPDCPHEKLVEIYHEMLPTCPRVVEWNDTRRSYLRARWRERAKANGKSPGYASMEEGIAWWRRFLGWCSESAFLTGRTNGRDGKPPFLADFEWIVRSTNFTRIIEGKYHRDAT